jgi:hypothetical protein
MYEVKVKFAKNVTLAMTWFSWKKQLKLKLNLSKSNLVFLLILKPPSIKN